MPSDPARHLSLHEAADLLGVHYMTIYRRVRLGILPARKIGGTWLVDPADLERATTTPERGRRRRGGSHPRVSIWQERLQARMLGGDVAGSWQVIEAAMASGFEPGEIYVRVLAPSLHAIGASWRSGRVSIDQEHLASSVATTLIGRLGPRFVHPGRKKGVVIVAMPPGERHGLGVAMLADILADAGYGVLNLGPDTPTASLVAAMRDAGSLAAVVVSVVDIERRPAAGRLLAAARRERPSVPRLVGGNAVPDERRGARSRCGRVGRGSARARRPDRSAQGTGMMQPLPAPVAGVPFDVETAAGRVSAYELGEGRTVLLLHSFNAAGSGIELAPLASRLAEHRRVVLVDWLGFGTSDRPDAPYGWALYGEQLERIRLAALQPGETSVDVVALSLPGQYVVVAAAEHPERFGRIVLISPTGFGRFKGDAGRTSRNIYRFLRLTGIGRLLFAVLARRQVIRWFLRQTFADPEQVPREYERYCWRTCQQPHAYRAPLAFVSGLLNDPRAEGAYQRLANPTLLLFGDHPRFTDPAAAEALVAANSHLERITIEHAGDLPQLEQRDETAAVIERFLA